MNEDLDIYHSKINSKRLYFVTVGISCLIYLLHIIPIFSGTPYLWGTDQWRYLPYWMQIILCFTAIIGFIPPIRKILFQRLDFGIGRVNEILNRLPRWLKYIFFIFISFSVLWILRQRTHFLGDGYLRLRELASGKRYAPEEPFDNFIHSVLYEWSNKIIEIESVYIYSLVSIICGIIFLFLIYKFSKIFTSSKELRIITVAAFLMMGTVELFFGYVENYTILALLVMVYLYYGYRFLHSGFPLFVLAFLVSLAICTHPTGIVLLPSFLYLFIIEWSRKKKVGNLIRMIFKNLIAAVIPGVILLYIFQAGIGMGASELIQHYQKESHIVPLQTTSGIIASPYSLFSSGHFIEILNLYLLLFPFGFFVGAFVFFDKKVRKNIMKKDSLFFVIAGGSYFLFSFLFYMALGTSRDWDIFAAAGLPITFFSLHLLRNINTYILRKIGIVIILSMFLHFIPWIHVNSNTELSTQRFIKLIDSPYWSKHAKGYGYEELAVYYYLKNEYESALSFGRKAFDNIGSERYLYNIAFIHHKIGVFQMKNKNYDQAISEFLKVVEIDSNFVDAYGRLGLGFIYLKEFDKAVPFLKHAVKLNPDELSYWSRLGICYYNLKDWDAAEYVYKNAIKINPQIRVLYLNLGVVYIEKNEFNSAVNILLKALKSGYESNELYQNLGIALFRLGEIQGAIKIYKLAIEKNFVSPDLFYNLGEILLSIENISEAERYLSQAVKLNPQHQKAKLLLEKIQKTFKR